MYPSTCLLFKLQQMIYPFNHDKKLKYGCDLGDYKNTNGPIIVI